MYRYGVHIPSSEFVDSHCTGHPMVSPLNSVETSSTVGCVRSLSARHRDHSEETGRFLPQIRGEEDGRKDLSGGECMRTALLHPPTDVSNDDLTSVRYEPQAHQRRPPGPHISTVSHMVQQILRVLADPMGLLIATCNSMCRVSEVPSILRSPFNKRSSAETP